MFLEWFVNYIKKFILYTFQYFMLYKYNFIKWWYTVPKLDDQYEFKIVDMLLFNTDDTYEYNNIYRTKFVELIKYGVKWENLISELCWEVDLSKHPRLEVLYNINNKNYRYIYSAELDDIIKFPPINKEDVIKHVNSNHFKVDIMHASAGNEDLTQLVNEHYGPMGDFHKRNIKKKWITKEDKLEMMDSMGDSHIINNDEHLQFSEN